MVDILCPIAMICIAPAGGALNVIDNGRYPYLKSLILDLSPCKSRAKYSLGYILL
jgi:hypothetical protein